VGDAPQRAASAPRTRCLWTGHRGMTSDRWRRIEALYHEVQAHPPHERAEALATACAGDSALQAEVQSLLDQPEPVGLPGTPVVNVAVQAGAPAKATLTGQRVGVFEVRGLLGAGGMGEVYRAWDPRLAREVALKVLPGDVADNPARRRRFLEEARAIGSLNHPNIVAVFDVGVGEGIPFIATELLDGRQLQDEMDVGVLPIRRLLDLAVQIAAGLRAAHDAGIAHRDLKPQNVMVTRDGRVKILDFGLAKASGVDRDVTGGQPGTLTAPGIVQGTPNYMSPEQASGTAVDFRSDQFSFGLMLYGMATGVHPFRRGTTLQTMSAIVDDEARPIGELNAAVPPPLRWIIERCLAKNPPDRYASTADLSKDLINLQGRLTELTGQETRPVLVPIRSRRRTALTAAGVALLAGSAALLTPTSSGGIPALKYAPLVTDASFQGSPAWSPDGTALAYASTVDGVQQVFTKSLASSGGAHQVTDARFDCTDPFWSRDNTRIFYQSLARDAESLWSISSAGGPPELVVENAGRAAISPDGRTLAFFREVDTEEAIHFVGTRRTIWTASPTGTDLRRYGQAPFDTRTFVDGALRFSPDGSKLLVWVWGWSDDVSTTPSPEFWVLPWPTGTPYKVLTTLARAAPAAASFDWLPDARRIVISLWDERTTGMHLSIANVETGEVTPLTSTPGSENRPVVSPDGQRIAFAAEAIDFDLVEIPLDGSPTRRLLATSRNELDSTFMPDGSQYAYVSDKGGLLQIWLRIRDGQFERPIVGRNQFPDDQTLALGSPALSPKGDRIAYQRYAERSGYQIWVSTVAAAGPPVQLTSGSFYQDAPTWSPDGSEIAFVHRTKDDVAALVRARVGAVDRPTVILRNLPTLGSRPKWSPDSRWIATDTSDGLVIVTPDGKDSRLISQEIWIAHAWSPDSRHIYGLREADRPGHYALAIIDIDTKKERVINPELGVIPPAFQPIRGLSLMGPGSLVTSVASARSDIWMAEGLERPSRTLLSRLWRGN
jgi:serine/threonine protein kinase